MHIVDIVISYIGLFLWVFGIYLFFRSNLRSILGQAWAVIWRRKYLWFVGFFAGLSTYGGEVNFLFRKSNSVVALQGLLDGIRDAIRGGDVERFWTATKNLWSNNVGPMFSYSLAALVVAALVIWLVIMSQAAIVRIVGREQQGKPTSLFDGIYTGMQKFWTLLQVNIVALLVGWGLWVILAGVPAAAYLISGHVAWSSAAHFGSILSTITTVILLFLLQYATAGVVLNDQTLIPALVGSWRLFRRNVMASLEMAIVLFTITFVFSLAILGAAALLVNIYTVGGFISMLVILALVYAFFSAYGFTTWSLFYLRLLEGKGGSKLSQWTTQIVNFATQKRTV